MRPPVYASAKNKTRRATGCEAGSDARRTPRYLSLPRDSGHRRQQGIERGLAE